MLELLDTLDFFSPVLGNFACNQTNNDSARKKTDFTLQLLKGMFTGSACFYSWALPQSLPGSCAASHRAPLHPIRICVEENQTFFDFLTRHLNDTSVLRNYDHFFAQRGNCIVLRIIFSRSSVKNNILTNNSWTYYSINVSGHNI